MIPRAAIEVMTMTAAWAGAIPTAFDDGEVTTAFAGVEHRGAGDAETGDHVPASR